MDRAGKTGQLLKKLQTYGNSDFYPLHMPGHKRNKGYFSDVFAIDITEIEGFDNLFHAEGILLEAQQRAAALYGADETFYLINGSSCGILAAVSACTKRNSRILMSRNSHKAAYHAVLLNDLRSSYLYPSVNMEHGMNGSIAAADVRTALTDSGGEIQAVLITSPTYDGVVSDIAAIADVVHEAGAVLIVDEAHGAHFAMSDYFPQTALALGADIVINSLHKTMPSLTQTALLHVKGERVDRARLKKYLGIYQSSSPSYVLMAGMDDCVSLMLEQKDAVFSVFVQRLERLRGALRQMKVLHLIDGSEAGLTSFDYDRSKVIISTAGCDLSGPKLGQLLRRDWHLEPEMEAERYVTAIMTSSDSQEGFERLEQALLTIDEQMADSVKARSSERIWQSDKNGTPVCRTEQVFTICQAEEAPKECVLLGQSAGRISGEFVYLYPPGIPLLVPGERIPADMPKQISDYSAAGLHVQGLQDHTAMKIQVLKEKECQ